MSATASQPSGTSYIERKINLTITLGEGQFGGSGQNSVKLQGLRIIATIQKLGPPAFGTAEVRVFGLPPSIMNEVSTLGVPLNMIRLKNTITVEAGDDVSGMATVYNGYIYRAWQNFDYQPETLLQIVSNTGAVDAIAPATPTSVQGGGDVATIMSNLAQRMPGGARSFQNHGVQVQISNIYLAGTAMEQAHELARQANIEMQDDGPGGVLAIWPKNGTRGGTTPLISVQSGLIGYPRYQDQGVSIRCLFTPNLSIGNGSTFELRSSLGGAPISQKGATQEQAQRAGPNGIWYITRLTYDLASQVPNGPWFCDVDGARTLLPPK